MKEYLGQLEKFDKRHKIDTENPKELIKELEDELNKSIYKISHINGKIDKEEVKDTNDIEKVKKNNKLLELVIVNIYKQYCERGYCCNAYKLLKWQWAWQFLITLVFEGIYGKIDGKAFINIIINYK